MSEINIIETIVAEVIEGMAIIEEIDKSKAKEIIKKMIIGFLVRDLSIMGITLKEDEYLCGIPHDRSIYS